MDFAIKETRLNNQKRLYDDASMKAPNLDTTMVSNIGHHSIFLNCSTLGIGIKEFNKKKPV